MYKFKVGKINGVSPQLCATINKIAIRNSNLRLDPIQSWSWSKRSTDLYEDWPPTRLILIIGLWQDFHFHTLCKVRAWDILWRWKPHFFKCNLSFCLPPVSTTSVIMCTNMLIEYSSLSQSRPTTLKIHPRSSSVVWVYLCQRRGKRLIKNWLESNRFSDLECFRPCGHTAPQIITYSVYKITN